MRKNSLATAILVGIAGVIGLHNLANAYPAENVLIYPYYAINAELPIPTIYSNVRFCPRAKPVKVRFVGDFK